MKKISIIILIISCIVIFIGSLMYRHNIISLEKKDELIEELRNKNNTLKIELFEKNEENNELLLKNQYCINTILGYNQEIRDILNRLSYIFPKIEYKNELEKKQIDIVIKYVQENFEENNVLICIDKPEKAIGLSNENKVVVHALLYEIQSKNDILKKEGPRGPADVYLRSTMFVLEKEDDKWLVKEVNSKG